MGGKKKHRLYSCRALAIALFVTFAAATVAVPAAAGPVYSWYEDDQRNKCWQDPDVSSTRVKGWPRGEEPDYNGNGVVCYYWARAV